MSAPLAVLIGFLFLALVFGIVWAVQLRTLNAGMVDPVWSWALGLLGVWYALVGTGAHEGRWLTGTLAGLWGLRLGAHLWARNYGKPEDGRYRRFREEWGDRAAVKMFWFFQFQVVLAILLSLGFAVVAYRDTAPSTAAAAAAILIWLVSVAGESLADWQLERFKANPANHKKVCQEGLWRYSRHPNYFFECVHWLAYVPLALGSPYAWLSLVPLAVMWFLLLKVSGIPMTEQQTAKNRPEYAEYMRTTSAFIPWPPKRRAAGH